MMTGIFYGSTTGNTQALAQKIAERLGIGPEHLHDVGSASIEQTTPYDTLLLGSSTWGVGDLQDDWYSFIDTLKATDLSGKKIGLFGCGDSSSYPDSFGDAIGLLHEALSDSGCRFIGLVPATDYPLHDSKAFQGSSVLGLLADDDAPEKTSSRLETWVAALQNT